jgi:eukaryotic translation initiation factor 2C
MELCSVERYNRYPFKLNPNETSEMIRFAVQRPGVRRNEIMSNVKLLNWGGDRFLREFGVKVDPNMPVVPAKIIKNPEVQFGGSKINPGVSGRWDLRNKKFIAPNKTPLRSWAFCVLDSSCDKPTLDNFIKNFINGYKGHGGRIERPPMTYSFNPMKQHNEIVEEVYKQTGKAQKESPQIVFFILKE